MSDPKKSPLSSLTPEQTDRLRRLQEEIQFDKLTLSFSIEDRDPNGRKKSAFYSVTASRGAGSEVSTLGEPGQSVGFASKDVKIVRALLSKHVVAATYEDAMRRGILSQSDALHDMRAILASYDESLVRLLQQTPIIEPGDAQ